MAQHRVKIKFYLTQDIKYAEMNSNIWEFSLSGNKGNFDF